MKIRFLQFIGKSNSYFLILLAVLFLTVNLLTRLTLQLAFSEVLPISGDMIPALLSGLLNDLATLVFVLLFPATLLLLPQNTFTKKITGKVYVAAIFFVFSLVFIFSAFAEFFFWDEFGSRFNFIAVDYLIYTTELVRNIVESYPLFPLLVAVFILALIATFCMCKILWRIQDKIDISPKERNLKKRLAVLGGLYLAAFLVLSSYSPLACSQSRFWNEYSKNGTYELFSAYRNNQLDYRAFYRTIDKSVAFSLVQSEIRDSSKDFEPPYGHSLIRMVDAAPIVKKPNVIIVIMESMGTKWFGEYTPNLNQLATEGLSFSNMMSTGTRTVRGLEAVMLSVPPTPGNSIVRRPENDKLFSLGTVFKENGYDRSFIYGGIGFFDNMNAFFANNGYEVTDKLDFASENKTFSNAWGQCDEDLYAQSLLQADKSHAEGRLFQQVLLTTSNHRPFTYPEGKIALESGASGRKGAIQYSDYAIGEFIRKAKTKPWFDNTVFVFVGDHPSSIAGKVEVPADAYGIVCIMYGPQFFAPEKIETLCSQIDIAPTLFANLGWGYMSQFFGTDARTLSASDGRAWISTYQLLGFRTNEHLVVLKPDTTVMVTPITPEGQTTQSVDTESNQSDKAIVARAIASYQCAYDLFSEKRMKEYVVLNHMPKPISVVHQIDSAKEKINKAGNSMLNGKIFLPTKKKADLLLLAFLLEGRLK